MKDFIFLNYNIIVEKIFFKNNKYFFFINDYKIYVIKINNDEIKNIEDLILLTNNLYNRINVNTFIINKEKKYITKYNDNYIALVRVNNIENDFELNDLFKFWNININLKEYNILNEWKNEIDKLEEKLIMFNKEFKKVQSSVNYFIGMGENAIQLLNNYKNIISSNNDSIGHRLSYKLFKDFSLYDPLTFIKTNKMYDISNYIKYKFFINEINYNEIESFFINGNEYENVFLFCNLLYPNVYFDLIERVLDEKDNENKIDIIINKRNMYKKLLIFCKKIVKNNKNIKLINWIDL